MLILEPYIAADDVWVLPSYLPAPGLGSLVVNSYLIKSSDPILIDTGMPVVKEEFLSALWSLIDPKDLKWVLLTHDDAGHSGALMEVLEAAPQARVHTQFAGLARLDRAYHMPVHRVEIVNPGDTFDGGGRELGNSAAPSFRFSCDQRHIRR